MPSRILSFIDGCPSKVTHVEIRSDADDERLFFSTQRSYKSKSAQHRLTQPVHIDKIFRLIENEGFRKDDLYDMLDASHMRVQIITRAISTYMKKNIQMMEYDPSLDDKQNLQNLPPSKLESSSMSP